MTLVLDEDDPVVLSGDEARHPEQAIRIVARGLATIIEPGIH